MTEHSTQCCTWKKTLKIWKVGSILFRNPCGVVKHNLVHPLFFSSHWNLLNKPHFRTKHYSSHRFCVEWNYLPPPPPRTSRREAWLSYWLICANGNFFYNTVLCWVKGVNFMGKRYKVHAVPDRQAHSSVLLCIILQLFIRKTKCEDMELNCPVVYPGRCSTLVKSVINLWVSLRKVATFRPFKRLPAPKGGLISVEFSFSASSLCERVKGKVKLSLWTP
jgi:hypothetical protein